MAITSIADMQKVPAKFGEYINQKATAKSALVRSGVCVENPEVNKLINGMPKGGNMLSIPFYNPLSGEDEVFGEEEMGVDKVTTGADIATLLVRQKAWGDTDLAAVFGGDDPMEAIAEMSGDYWDGREQVALVNILAGLFGASGCLVKDHMLDISKKEGTDCLLTVESTLDGKQLMGDAADKLAAVAMHSATFTSLQKQNLIQTIPASETRTKIDTYLGYEVIVDDDMPVTSGVYTTVLLGKGAFARNAGTPQGLVGVEPYRDALKSASYLINRRAFVLHPMGCQFVGTTFDGGKHYAANTDLAKAANWKVSAHLKNIPIVAIKHKLTANAAAAAKV